MTNNNSTKIIEAIESAKREHNEALKRRERLATSKNISEAKSAWSDLLIRIQRIYNRMAAGCKSDNQKIWWSAKLKARSEDPLLQYLHQARHAEEHGLDDIMGALPPSFGIAPVNGRMQINSFVMVPGINGPVISADVAEGRMTLTPARLGLVPVKNRGVQYEPPAFHLGEFIGDKTPLGIAGIAISYCGTMIQEAAEEFS